MNEEYQFPEGTLLIVEHAESSEGEIATEEVIQALRSILRKKQHNQQAKPAQLLVDVHNKCTDKSTKSKNTNSWQLQFLNTFAISKTCPICGIEYNSRDKLVEHLSSLLKKAPHKCCGCDYKTSNGVEYLAHTQTHIGIPKEEPCEVSQDILKHANILETTINWRKKYLQLLGEKPDTCAICKTQFKTEADMRNHMLTTFVTTPYECCMCDYSTEDGEEYYAHTLAHTEKSFLCELCGAKFLSRSGIYTHKLRHKRTFNCTLCEYSTMERLKIRRHLKTHPELFPFSNNKSTLVACQHGHKKCQHCKFTVSSIEDVREHTRTHMQRNTMQEPVRMKNYVCAICSYRCYEPYALSEHMLKHAGQKQYQCEICARLFKYKTNLYRHKRIHTEEKRFKCENCDYRAHQKATIQSHMQTMHPPGIVSSTDFCCEHCNYTNPLHSRLLIHLRTHAVGMKHKKRDTQKIDPSQRYKRYLCTQCPFRSAYKSTMGAHIKRHSGVREFKCNQCDYSAFLKNALELHMRRHAGLKPYTCGICNKNFRQKSHLGAHLRSHTGERPYQCPFCGKCFAHLANFLEHKVRHTGENRFKCKICDFATPFRTQLKRHVSQHLNN